MSALLPLPPTYLGGMYGAYWQGLLLAVVGRALHYCDPLLELAQDSKHAQMPPAQIAVCQGSLGV